jgi:hypothetical protein
LCEPLGVIRRAESGNHGASVLLDEVNRRRHDKGTPRVAL